MREWDTAVPRASCSNRRCDAASVDDFDRHVTAEEGVARAVDLAHAACTQRGTS